MQNVLSSPSRAWPPWTKEYWSSKTGDKRCWKATFETKNGFYDSEPEWKK